MTISQIIYLPVSYFGISCGIVFGFIYIVIFSKTKLGKQFRHDLYDLVEKGRRYE